MSNNTDGAGPAEALVGLEYQMAGKIKPVMVQDSPFNPWYSTTRNFAAAATVLWFALGRRVDPSF